MKRSAMPRRTKALTSTQALTRAGRLRARSAKQAKVYRDERVPLVKALLAEFPRCQMQVRGVCTQAAVDVHERLSRGRGGSILKRENLLTACRACHDWATTHPAEAEALGLSLRTGVDTAHLRA